MAVSESTSKLILEYSKAFVQEPICSHQIEECNGCLLMPIPYEKQLELKGKIVSEYFGKNIKVEPAPRQFTYRNRIDLLYSNGRLGFRHKNRMRESYSLKYCHLISPQGNAITQHIAKRLIELGIEETDIMKRKPGIRYVVLRSSRQNEFLVGFVFFGAVDEKIFGLCEELIDMGVKSANILVNDTWSDTGFGTLARTFGKDHIDEQMLGKTFGIGPNTFFQTNVESAERIFGIVREHVPKGAKVLDLYCGVGTITCTVAGKCSYVVGIESNFESISGARKNAIANGVLNARFIFGNVDKMLPHMKGFDTVIADPPRSGMNPKAIKRLNELAPQKIVYVSCSPQTLARDLKMLEGYEIKEFMAFDQFPQTPHMEMLAVLEKI